MESSEEMLDFLLGYHDKKNSENLITNLFSLQSLIQLLNPNIINYQKQKINWSLFKEKVLPIIIKNENKEKIESDDIKLDFNNGEIKSDKILKPSIFKPKILKTDPEIKTNENNDDFIGLLNKIDDMEENDYSNKQNQWKKEKEKEKEIKNLKTIVEHNIESSFDENNKNTNRINKLSFHSVITNDDNLKLPSKFSKDKISYYSVTSDFNTNRNQNVIIKNFYLFYK